MSRRVDIRQLDRIGERDKEIHEMRQINRVKVDEALKKMKQKKEVDPNDLTNEA